jgi:hypothetical protein
MERNFAAVEEVMRGNGRSRPAGAVTALAVAALWCLACASSGARAEDTASSGSAAAPPATPEVTVLGNHEVEGILGREVLSATNENMGRIVDVLVDRGGEVRAAIIDFGGFLGVGSRKIAVDWTVLHFPPPAKRGARITLELTRDQVKAAPEYRDGKPVVVLGALGKLESLPLAD